MSSACYNQFVTHMKNPTLKLIVLRTNRPEALREFYSRLGFEFVTEQHGRGPQHYSAPLGDGIIEIYPLSDDAEADVTTRLGFEVVGLAAVLVRLSSESAPKQTPWGLRAVVRDPDGRAVELYEASPTAGATNA